MTKQTPLKDKLHALPDHPGVYLFKDARGRIIYIGKAKSLRDRVRSYFTARDDGRYQFPRLVAAIRDFEVILTRDEVEALSTEAALIRRHQPRYNVDLKDDKSFPYLMVTREPYPRIFLTRKPHTSAADYYGPFTNVKETKWLLRDLKGILQVRDCNLPLTDEKIAAGKFKLCLDYHIGRCGGPCEALVNQEQYRRGVDDFIKFIRGGADEVVAALESDMKSLAADMNFEEAAKARDRLTAARRFSERQLLVERKDIERDAVGLAREDDYAAFTVIQVRGGRIVGKSPFHMERAAGLTDGELMEAFLIRHYELTDTIPREIYLSVPLPDAATVAEYLSQKAARRISLHTPERGDKRGLVEIATANAGQLMLERRLMAEKRDFVPRSLKSLQEVLKLPDPPRLIEAFDVSHLSGQDTVASMVIFKDAKPFKSGYRIFKMRTVEGIDDFAAVGEAVGRRYRRLIADCKLQIADWKDDNADAVVASQNSETRNPKSEIPNLVLIDGGAGQLHRAKQVLDELGLSKLPVIGLAKRLEEIYVPNRQPTTSNQQPLILPKTSTALRLLQQIRDEAHRFAVTRQRLLRGKRQVKSRLDDIPGIGPARRQALLKRFGSVKRIGEASVEEIAAVKGMNAGVAERIKLELAGEKA